MQQEVNLTFEELQNSEYLSGFDEPKRALAAGAVLGLTLEEMPELEESRENFYGVSAYKYEYGRAEVIVMTDDEADDANREYAENTYEELVEPYLNRVDPTMIQAFNKEAWIRAVEVEDGRGINLAGWDSTEHEQCVAGEYFYVYKQNM